jgi:hypothetical protein
LGSRCLTDRWAACHRMGIASGRGRLGRPKRQRHDRRSVRTATPSCLQGRWKLRDGLPDLARTGGHHAVHPESQPEAARRVRSHGAAGGDALLGVQADRSTSPRSGRVPQQRQPSGTAAIDNPADCRLTPRRCRRLSLRSTGA